MAVLDICVLAMTIVSLICASDGLLNSPPDQSCTHGSDVQIGWVDENAANVFVYTWSFKYASASTFQDILTLNHGKVTNTNVLSNVAYHSDATISLTSVTAANDGTYKCTVAYNLGEIPMSDSDEVIMTVAKSHLNSPPDQSCAQGTDVQIGWVDDNAANVLTYTWSFKADSSSTFQNILIWSSGTVIHTNVLSNIAHVSGATISLTSVTAANAGTYKCTVAYNLGQSPLTEFDEVTITVETP